MEQKELEAWKALEEKRNRNSLTNVAPVNTATAKDVRLDCMRNAYCILELFVRLEFRSEHFDSPKTFNSCRSNKTYNYITYFISLS